MSLYGERSGEVLSRLREGDDSQARHLAEIIQRVRPDVLLLNEIDNDPAGETVQAFCEKYLAVPQHISQAPSGPAEPIAYAYWYSAPSNTGKHSGFDLNRDGRVEMTPGSDAFAADCWGYGQYEGQYALAVLSKFPIDRDAIRTFQSFRWKDMPAAMVPDDPTTPAPADWYRANELKEFPLSSKNHCDVPVVLGDRVTHLLVSHPTPPIFDGDEDRNGRRNHDEIRLWKDYVGPANRAAYIYDDQGKRGGLAHGESFIILGDLNSDPHDGDGPTGIRQLLASPRVLEYAPPASAGAAEQSRLQGDANANHRGDPSNDTCDPADSPGPGNLRIDYVLPSADLAVGDSGVFWPTSDDPMFRLVGVHPFPSSDHRLVWVDVIIASNEPSTNGGRAERSNR
ncbi:MAG TPA: endonuclease/exonuclease/phosphatase family protein [Lacipirellula sp.]